MTCFCLQIDVFWVFSMNSYTIQAVAALPVMALLLCVAITIIEDPIGLSRTHCTVRLALITPSQSISYPGP